MLLRKKGGGSKYFHRCKKGDIVGIVVIDGKGIKREVREVWMLMLVIAWCTMVMWYALWSRDTRQGIDVCTNDGMILVSGKVEQRKF